MRFLSQVALRFVVDAREKLFASKAIFMLGEDIVVIKNHGFSLKSPFTKTIQTRDDGFRPFRL